MSTFEAIMNSILSMQSNFCLNTCLFHASSLIHIYLNHIPLKYRQIYFSCYSWHVYVLHSGFACVAWTWVPTAHVRSGASARPTDATCKLEQTQNGVWGRSIPKWSTRNFWEFRIIHSWSFLVTFTGQTANERDSICAMKKSSSGPGWWW